MRVHVCRYGASMVVILMSLANPATGRDIEGIQALWIVLFVASTLYSYWWDVYMDWALGDRKHGFLRESLMYSARWYYYFVLVVGLLLRFVWMYQMIPVNFLPSHVDPKSGAWAYMVVPTVTIAELGRRFMWASVRVENQHLSCALPVGTHHHPGVVPLHFDSRQAPKRLSKTPLRIIAEAAVIIGVVVLLAVIATWPQHS